MTSMKHQVNTERLKNISAKKKTPHQKMGIILVLGDRKLNFRIICLYRIIGSSEYAPLVRDNVIVNASQQSRTRILNSKVISASLGKGRHIQLSQPIRLVLKHLLTDNVTNPACVFWNYIDQYVYNNATIYSLFVFIFPIIVIIKQTIIIRG